MKWDKIKTFLIIMLVLVNLFFGVTLYLQHSKTNYISSRDLQNLTRLLSGSIKILAGALPSKKQESVFYGGTYPENYFENAVYLLSGEADPLSYVTPNGINFVTDKESTDTYEFTYPFGFKYVYNAGGDSDVYEIDAGSVSKLPETNFVHAFYTRSAVKRFLNAGGALNGSDVNSGLRIKLKSGAVYYDSINNIYITAITQYAGSQPIYGCEAVVAVKDKRVVFVEGSLIFCNLDESFKTELRDQVNLLLLEKRELSQNGFETDGSKAESNGRDISGDNADIILPDGNKAFSAETEGNETTVKIADDDGLLEMQKELTFAESCLCITWNADRSKFYLLPGWKFIYNGFDMRIRNAVNGSIYTK